MSKSKVLLIGMGGVGTIAAYALEYGGKAEVTAVLRSDYDLLKEKGFEINSVDYGHIPVFRPTNIVKSIGEANEKFGPFDYAVFTTKCIPDVNPIEPLIKEAYVKGKTSIVLLQNGFGIENDTLEDIPEATVISGVTMISSTLYHGVVQHVGEDLLKFGLFNTKASNAAEQKALCEKFVELYSNDKNQCSYDDDVKFTRWRKLVYNATLNSTCAITNLDTGRIELFGGNGTIIKPAMAEVIAIAKSDGVDLPAGIDDFMIRSDDPNYYAPSMLVDLRKGNFIEYQVILGNALKVAKKNNVPTPTLTVLYNLLHLIQMRTMEEHKKFELPEVRPSPDYKIEFK
ncbi:unnamed protein product [[Candida] boidinii]|uniref:2-dehydropantoate 2-reductase n=1 Tax=Candida boidinii TaxID=5477 RepID=A0A9W6SYZ0_CANBO|nr:2-dehydropantoate 2-reductase activity protein [[Candida] boidinii]OWB86285.1 2-dehydropantoate 2-reductase activity protein [[Candida] boidinii]GME69652.1 unnamed protein product [[Candida] boidinii]GMG11714.1 unnamed protein product [[Candida] boidinii]